MPSHTRVFEVILSVFTLQVGDLFTTQHQYLSVVSVIECIQVIIWLLTTTFLLDGIKTKADDSDYYSIVKCNWHVINKTDNKYQLSLYIDGVYNATWLLYYRILLNMSILRCCPACAKFMSALVRAVYHHNELDLAATAYRIRICVKNWVNQCVVGRFNWGVGPIVPWFTVGFVMVEMFFVSVWCVMADHTSRPMSVILN